MPKNKKEKIVWGITGVAAGVVLILGIDNVRNIDIAQNIYGDTIEVLASQPEANLDTVAVKEFEEGSTNDNIYIDDFAYNEIADIMIVMYHGIYETLEPENRYHRSVQGFKDDLQSLYDNGYRVISLNDWINGNVNVEKGYTPVVITFDDGLSSAFSLEEVNGELVPAKNTAVDIMDKFYEEHPDFGKAATFFVYGDSDVFRGAGTVNERFEYLINNGYDIGNHTKSHKNLKKDNDATLQYQIGYMDNYIEWFAPNYTVNSFAYPYGETPDDAYLSSVLSGKYENNTYNYNVALRASRSGGSTNPYNVGFNPSTVPRVRGTDNAVTDLGWSIKNYNDHPQLRYYSDGNPNTIVVPSEHADKVNMDAVPDWVNVVVR